MQDKRMYFSIVFTDLKFLSIAIKKTLYVTLKMLALDVKSSSSKYYCQVNLQNRAVEG